MPLFVALAAVLILPLTLAVRSRASAPRLARLRRAQEKWAEDMDHDRALAPPFGR